MGPSQLLPLPIIADNRTHGVQLFRESNPPFPPPFLCVPEDDTPLLYD